MAKPLQLIQVLKWESAAGGGDPLDDSFFPDEIEQGEDVLSAAGLALQPSGVQDKTVMIWRDSAGNEMMFEDPIVGSGVSLSQLLYGTSGGGGLTENEHKVLRQLIHFIDEGPACGFGATASKVTIGGLFPTRIEWRDASNNLIVSKDIERSAGPATKVKPTPVVWKMYALNGTSVLCSVQDDITYTGIAESSRSRTIL